MSGVKRKVAKCLVRLACAVMLQYCLNKLEFKRKRKWVRRWVSRWEEFGASNNILMELAVQEPAGYMNVLRMHIKKFEELLAFLLQ